MANLRTLAVSLGCLALTVGCARPLPTPTPDAQATEVALAAIVQATLTALAPTATPVLTATPTHTPRPTATPRPSATKPPPTWTPRPLEAYYLFMEDYQRVAEPYVANGQYPSCKLVIPYAMDPSMTYYYPGFEPGGSYQKLCEMGGIAYDPNVGRRRLVRVECR